MADVTFGLLCETCTRFVPTSSEEYSPEKQCRTFLRAARAPFDAMAEVMKGNPLPQQIDEFPFQVIDDPPTCRDYLQRPPQ